MQVLSENAELSSRLIELALTSDNDVFNAAFGNDSSTACTTEDGTAAAPLGHWSREGAEKRRKEAEDEVGILTCRDCNRVLATVRKDTFVCHVA